MADAAAGNVCQYWSPEEPGRCQYWDNANGVCNKPEASFYPQCNGVGSKLECKTYSSTETVKARCILPDISRHVTNRKTGEQWVKAAVVNPLTKAIISMADTTAITQYNGGDCDGWGTSARCSAYSPFHMAFSALTPASGVEGETALDYDHWATISGGEFAIRLPLNFVIYNFRAKLGRCYWWPGDASSFSVTSSGVVQAPTFICNNPNANIQNDYKDFKWNDELNMYRPPCNGCKPECLGYTGPCWKYCKDSKMRQGDKVLAEQILELRYHIRKSRWSEAKMANNFKKPYLFAWSGAVEYSQRAKTMDIEQSIVPAYLTRISNYENFTVTHTKKALSTGTPADDYGTTFPDLVKELKNCALAPIIRNKFDGADSAGDNGYFETTSLSHNTFPIFGEFFGYNEPVYGLNLSDPDVLSIFPSYIKDKLKSFDNMSDLKSAFDVQQVADLNAGLRDPDDQTVFEEFYSVLNNFLDFLLASMPNKMVGNSWSAQNSNFYVPVNTFFGLNEIFVFTKWDDRWEYDKINFTKRFIGGVIGETEFTVTGKGEVNYLPAYDSDFSAYLNKNGTIKATFFPIATNGADKIVVDHVYNDGVRKRLLSITNPETYDTYEMSYKLYEVPFPPVATGLTLDNLRFLGNNGYVLAIINDLTIQRYFRSWIAKDGIFIYYSNDDKSEMEIVDENNNNLEPNQIILKSKSITSFRSMCDSDLLTLESAVMYDKYATDAVPNIINAAVIYDTFVVGADRVVYRNSYMSIGDGGNFTITDFGYDNLVPAVVFKGSNGRVKGHTKSKLITWVRQPFCRDVEIFYSWYRAYTKSKLLPEYECYGTPGVRADPKPAYQSYTPPCGDHQGSFFNGKGPMWYPYTACDDYARYEIMGNLTEWDINIMDPFWEGAADPPHDASDMRMLGVADNFGVTGESHASLWSCLCDWTFYNYTQISANMFNGYGRFRGGLDYAAKLEALRNGGSLPKFGNVFRDFLRSYRSMDNVEYYYWDGSVFSKKKKWVPAAESFSDVDISASPINFPYQLYCSSDYYDDKSCFCHPFGLLLAYERIENIDISETIDAVTRKRFDDVFDTHSTLAGIYYPMPRDPQYKLVGSTLTLVVPWYTYKNPGADPTVSTQWAWREVWKELVRGQLSTSNFVATTQTDPRKTVYTCCETSRMYNKDESYSVPYIEGTTDPVGKHLFLTCNYPDYQYDYTLKEHRLVAEEGDYELIISAPTFNIVENTDTSDYYCDKDFWIYMSKSTVAGPFRSFDISGNWEPLNSEYISQISPSPGAAVTMNANFTNYGACTTSPWSEDVTLFDGTFVNRSTTKAETDGRVISTYDAGGIEEKLYYQRGLNVILDSGMFHLLPKKESRIDPSKYEISFSAAPIDIGSGGFEGEIVPFDPYPGVNFLNFVYDSGITGGVTITIEIPYTSVDDFADSGLGVVSLVDFEFALGAENFAFDSSGALDDGTVYCIPAISVYVDGRSYVCSSMTLPKNLEQQKVETVRCSCDVDTTYSDVYDTKKAEADYRLAKIKGTKLDIPKSTIVILMRLAPTLGEEADLTKKDKKLFPGCVKKVWLKSLYVYGQKFMDATEFVDVYERKYYTSTGKHGDFPPHGYDSTGSLLYPIPEDRSTVYQYDSIGGVVGMPGSAGACDTMNKIRGRLLYACHPDKESLDVPRQLDRWEARQKEIHDAIALEGSTLISMKSAILPGLAEYLATKKMYFTQPSWNCAFTNDLVRSLLAVEEKASYSPCGHFFEHDFENMHMEYSCGAHGYIFARIVADVFDYVWKHACGTDVSWTSIDALTAYFRGIGNIMINPFIFIAAAINRRDEVTARRLASRIGNVSMSFPSPVNPVH